MGICITPVQNYQKRVWIIVVTVGINYNIVFFHFDLQKASGQSEEIPHYYYYYGDGSIEELIF